MIRFREFREEMQKASARDLSYDAPVYVETPSGERFPVTGITFTLERPTVGMKAELVIMTGSMPEPDDQAAGDAAAHRALSTTEGCREMLRTPRR